MKKILALVAASVLGALSMSADTYSYLAVAKSDGTVKTFDVGSLVITFDGTTMLLTNEAGSNTFMTPALEKIYFTNSASDDETTLLGDVNGDGIVDAADVTMLVSMVLGNETPNLDRGDMNSDGVLDAADVTQLVTKILGN